MHDTYTEAMQEAARYVEQGYAEIPRILLNPAELIPTQGEDIEAEFAKLLHHDPVISAIFKLGVQMGRNDARA